MARGDGFDDIAGQTFGEWTVISLAFRRGKDWYWLCRCTCGTLQPVRGTGLRGGETHKCRDCANALARQYEDLTGHTYGAWYVISLAGRDSRGKYRWNCRCTCGREQTILRQNLVQRPNGRCQTCAAKLRWVARLEKKREGEA